MNQNIAIFFPYLHEEYIDPKLSSKGKILNIGFLESKENVFTPKNLYFSPKEAKHYLNFCLEFGEQFRDLRDMRAYLLQEKSPLDPEGVLKIKEELSGKTSEPKKVDETLKNHILLILYYAYEERVMEIAKIEKDLDQKIDSIKDIIGVEEELGFSKKLFFQDLVSRYELKVDLLLPAFSFFVPEAYFVLTSKEVVKELEEMGLKWEEQSQEDSWVLLKGKYQNTTFVYYKEEAK